MIVLMIVHSQQSSWLPSERSEMERECSRISISGDERAGDGEADIEGKGTGFHQGPDSDHCGKAGCARRQHEREPGCRAHAEPDETRKNQVDSHQVIQDTWEQQDQNAEESARSGLI